LIKLVEANIRKSAGFSSKLSVAVGDFMVVAMVFAGIYGLYTSAAWVLVIWCNKVTVNAAKRLSTSTLGLRNLRDFKGLKWWLLEELGHVWS
jgi:hypothetical protein